MYLQIYIPQREQHYTVIADKTGNHNFPACMEIYMHGQAEIYAGAYFCIARFLPECLSKTRWSQSACIKCTHNHQLQETPACIIPTFYISHAAVEIFLSATCCILCCILCRLRLQSQQLILKLWYQHHLKLLMCCIHLIVLWWSYNQNDQCSYYILYYNSAHNDRHCRLACA